MSVKTEVPGSVYTYVVWVMVYSGSRMALLEVVVLRLQLAKLVSWQSWGLDDCITLRIPNF